MLQKLYKENTGLGCQMFQTLYKKRRCGGQGFRKHNKNKRLGCKRLQNLIKTMVLEAKGFKTL